MKMCLTAGLIWSLLLIPASVAADSEKKVKMGDLPAAVQQAVNEQSKDGKIRGLTKEVADGKTIYELELSVNGHGKDVSFDTAGKIVSVEEEVPLASLPEAARSAIQKAVGSGKLQKLESVTENGASFYEASIRKAGKDSEVKVDAKGATVK